MKHRQKENMPCAAVYGGMGPARRKSMTWIFLNKKGPLRAYFARSGFFVVKSTGSTNQSDSTALHPAGGR